jgi:hypothetical protein
MSVISAMVASVVLIITGGLVANGLILGLCLRFRITCARLKLHGSARRPGLAHDHGFWGCASR